MKTSQIIYLIVSLIFLYNTENLAVISMITEQDDNAKKAYLKELTKEYQSLNATSNKLRETLKKLKKKVQSNTDDNERIKYEILRKKYDLSQLKKKKITNTLPKKPLNFSLANDDDSVILI